MRTLTLLIVFLLGHLSFAQTNIDQILELGVKDNGQRFAQDYFTPAAEGMITALSNGWYYSGETKKKFQFDIGIVGNGSFVRKEKRSFVLDTANYNDNDIEIVGGTGSLMAGNIYGQNEQNIILRAVDGTEIRLPDGLGRSGTGFIPTAFIQVGMGLPRGTELKIRYMPPMAMGKNTKTTLYGVGVQNEITSWLYGGNRWPVRVSGLIGYTFAQSTFDFAADSVIDGDDKELRQNTNSWLISGIASTKREVFNFYGGLGIYSGSASTSLKGLYRIAAGPDTGEEIIDPLTVDIKESGVKATIGTSVTYGVLRVHLDYTFQNYNNLSLGLFLGW